MIGTRLKELRELRGYSIREAAKRSGYSRSHLSYIEQGKRLPSSSTISCITKALAMSDETAPLVALLRQEQIGRLC